MASPDDSVADVYVASSATRRRRRLQLLTDVTNASEKCKRACTYHAEDKIKECVKVKAPRGMHAVKTPSTSSSQAPHYNLRDRPEATQSPDLVTLRQLVKTRPHVISQGMHTLQARTERNTTFVTQKSVALQVVGACISTGMGILKSCEVAGIATGFNDQVVRGWAKEIYADFFGVVTSLENVTDEILDMQLESERGKHPKLVSLMSDENFQADVRKFVQENSNVKGRPNLTLQDVVTWLQETHHVEVCKSTVSLWLHEMGFSYHQHTKGVYFDGHEREDVVADRKAYLDTLQSLGSRMWTFNSPSPDPAIHPVIRIYHDETTYYANAYQSFHWTDGSNQVLKQKSLGQAIMVSDFVEEVGGMLECDGEKATLFLEHQSEGYFTNDMLISQVLQYNKIK